MKIETMVIQIDNALVAVRNKKMQTICRLPCDISVVLEKIEKLEWNEDKDNELN
jgi:hypothetical protein